MRLQARRGWLDQRSAHCAVDHRIVGGFALAAQQAPGRRADRFALAQRVGGTARRRALAQPVDLGLVVAGSQRQPIQGKTGLAGGQQRRAQEARLHFAQQPQAGGPIRQQLAQVSERSLQRFRVPGPIIAPPAQHHLERRRGLGAPQPAGPQRRERPVGLVGAWQRCQHPGRCEPGGRRGALRVGQVFQPPFEDAQPAFGRRRFRPGIQGHRRPRQALRPGAHRILQRQPDVLLQKARRQAQLPRPGAPRWLRPQAAALVKSRQQQRRQQPAPGGREAVQFVDQVEQRIHGARQVHRQGFLGMHPVGVGQRRHPFQGARPVQPAGGKTGGVLNVSRRGRALTGVFAVRAGVDAPRRRSRLALPDKGLHLHRPVALGALAGVQPAQIGLQPLPGLGRHRQVGQRLAQLGLARRAGVQLQQKAGDRVVGRHQHPVAGPRRLDRRARRSPERVHHPTARWQALCQPACRCSARQRRQVTVQRPGGRWERTGQEGGEHKWIIQGFIRLFCQISGWIGRGWFAAFLHLAISRQRQFVY